MNYKILNTENLFSEKVNVNKEEILKYKTEDQFIAILIELLKEISIFTYHSATIYSTDNYDNPKKWTRNEAILGGLMVRATKLQSSFLDQLCQNRLEIAIIIFRCLSETLINLKYLLEKKDDKIFDDYVEYSLKNESKLMKIIKNNIDKSGQELPIEKRINKSIERSFKKSSTEDISTDRGWGDINEKSIFDKTKKVGWEDLYLALIGFPSHSVHGNWQDLIDFHLQYENGDFNPNFEWNNPRPQIITPICRLSAEVDRIYLNKIIEDKELKMKISDRIDDYIERIFLVDQLHEKFIQKISDSK